MLALSNVSVISKDPSTERTVRGTGSDVAKASHKEPTSTAQRIRAIGVWWLLVMHTIWGVCCSPTLWYGTESKKLSQICRMCFHFWRGGSKEMIEMPHFLTRYSVKLWSRATSTIHVLKDVVRWITCAKHWATIDAASPTAPWREPRRLSHFPCSIQAILALVSNVQTSKTPKENKLNTHMSIYVACVYRLCNCKCSAFKYTYHMITCILESNHIQTGNVWSINEYITFYIGYACSRNCLEYIWVYHILHWICLLQICKPALSNPNKWNNTFLTHLHTSSPTQHLNASRNCMGNTPWNLRHHAIILGHRRVPQIFPTRPKSLASEESIFRPASERLRRKSGCTSGI